MFRHPETRCLAEDVHRYHVYTAQGCNLCVSVCPVVDCISMVAMTSGTDPRTGKEISSEVADWTTHENNPLKVS